jgi:hypothetical protein
VKKITPEKIVRKAKQLKIQARWSVNQILDKLSPAPVTLTCPICKFSGESDKFSPYRSRCVFGGGNLLRHECPECGMIFGTQRMLAMSDQELAQEYREHYSCHREGGATESEIRTFHYLNPNPEGIYLNYGCGKWAKTIQAIRAEGYNLMGYEPHAIPQSGYVISNLEELKSMRFDGIISNDVLEHFRYPVEALKFMASLLKENGVMVHCTHCYWYSHEYTRFHLFFFTGRSLDLICQQAGLTYQNTDRPDTKIFTRV